MSKLKVGVCSLANHTGDSEDAFEIDNTIMAYVVADGMGGSKFGSIASRLTVQSILQFLNSSSLDTERTWLFQKRDNLALEENFLRMAFLQANQRINGHIKDRQQQIRLAIPFVVDLLSLCTEAGLDFMAAIQRVVQKAKRSPLIEELEQVLNELKLGTTRADALRNMSDRINMSEISSLVAVLVTADKMGASISTALKSQSDQIRSERFIRAEKAGAAASQKILFPLIFFIVPAVFIVVLGPLVAKLLQQLFTGGFGGAGGGFF